MVSKLNLPHCSTLFNKTTRTYRKNRQKNDNGLLVKSCSVRPDCPILPFLLYNSVSGKIIGLAGFQCRCSYVLYSRKYIFKNFIHNDILRTVVSYGLPNAAMGKPEYAFKQVLSGL